MNHVSSASNESWFENGEATQDNRPQTHCRARQGRFRCHACPWQPSLSAAQRRTCNGRTRSPVRNHRAWFVDQDSPRLRAISRRLESVVVEQLMSICIPCSEPHRNTLCGTSPSCNTQTSAQNWATLARSLGGKDRMNAPNAVAPTARTLISSSIARIPKCTSVVSICLGAGMGSLMVRCMLEWVKRRLHCSERR